jgi:hypothetical protein
VGDGPSRQSRLALSRLQARIAGAVAALPEAEGFALAGGGALVVLGIVERPTEDLDYFATVPDAVDRLGPALERSLDEQGLTVERRRVLPGFAQYRITDGVEATALDLSWDTRLYPTQTTAVGAALATDELAADKMLALFGRAEARDFVDVYRLRTAYSRADLVRLAAAKDPGFSAERFAEAIGGIDRFERGDFPIDDVAYAELRTEFASWRRVVEIEQSAQRERRARRPDQEPPGIDLGL